MPKEMQLSLPLFPRGSEATHIALDTYVEAYISGMLHKGPTKACNFNLQGGYRVWQCFVAGVNTGRKYIFPEDRL